MRLRGRVGLALVLGTAVALGVAVAFLGLDDAPSTPDGQARESGPVRHPPTPNGRRAEGARMRKAIVPGHGSVGPHAAADEPAAPSDRAAGVTAPPLRAAELPRGPHTEIEYEHADPVLQATTDVAALELEAALAAAEGRSEDAERARAERDRAALERDTLARALPDAGRLR